mmetsp:Transcript_15775/g.47356  ORF Transcript_15775/g.47356 Transcript_15775/m.47356 type:complete len:501 (+) Transcript_15775:72-1574(+)
MDPASSGSTSSPEMSVQPTGSAATSIDEEALRREWEGCGQSHVFAHLTELTPMQRATLFSHLSRFSPSSLLGRWNATRAPPPISTASVCPVEPFEGHVEVLSETPAEQAAEWRSLGMGAIRSSRVACVVLAGGQGTRLGFEHPKGMYRLSIPSQMSLFEMQARRIRRLCSLAKETAPDDVPCDPQIPLYLMTSDATHEETVEFFEKNDFFGLPTGSVQFFKQNTLPAIGLDGKILMASPYELALSPNGNGGIYQALKERGVLSDMRQREVEMVFVTGVDNVLVRIADPVFVGYTLSLKSDCSVKVVAKSDPNERVGVLGLRGGKPSVLEYSEISSEQANERDEQGQLRFRCGNICIHLFSLPFLFEMAQHSRDACLPLHIAQKTVSTVDQPEPTVINAEKMELFIFDSFPFASNLVALEVRREEEFSPLKNATGSCSPVTCCEDLFALHRSYLDKAGAKLFDGEDGSKRVYEIDPLISYAGEGLDTLVKGKQYRSPCWIK